MKTTAVRCETDSPGEVQQLQTLPGDDARQIMWRYQDRYDIQMVVQSARSVARGPVARLVAAGARNTHEWTPEKARLFDAFDESGITSVFLNPEHGGFFGGPKNLALALAAFELAWVDGGAATCSLATNLALSPIHEKGTEEQKSIYMSRACPPQPGEARRISRGAFSLTEPLPYVGVETGLLSGKMRISEWEEGEEPILQVEKRGRFITNMAFANFVTAAVQSDDERIKGSCIIILEETDPGVFDRGSYTRKLVHQLSSTRDPVFSLRVPASRIVGGYTIKDGVIVPNYQHGDVIESVFRRTRVPVGLMTSAKLLSAVEPVIRYQRQRFRGAGTGSPGSPRYELGLQQKEDALHRLVDVWAAGEAGASFGFSTSRLLDEYDPLDTAKDEFFAKEGTETGRAQLKIFNKLQPEALELVELEAKSAPTAEEEARLEQLLNKPLVQFMVRDSLINVLGPAVKLWNTANGVVMMREAVSLMGGYGITEDCPGFLGQKWMDAQLEATYEGPESVQRRQLSVTMLNEVFLAQFRHWQREMREIAARKPGSGACTVATAMELWLKTLSYLQTAKDPSGAKLYTSNRQGVTFPMADALCWLLAARAQILDVLELEEKGPENPVLAEGLPGLVSFFTDLCHVQSGRAAGEVGRICAELVFGYQKHLAWDDKNDRGCCHQSDELTSLESFIPGIDGGARAYGSVIEDDGTHRDSAGPCVCIDGLETFIRLRSKLDGCLTGCRLAKDRAAQAITKVMIPETLDYPL